jgi:hypothetical protein
VHHQIERAAASGAESGASSPPRDPVWRAALIHALWIAIFLGVVGLIHNLTPNYQDGDTGYHLAVAQLTKKYGVLQAFPWTPFSWLADHYADKEFLFHVLMVPVANLDPNLAARLVGTLLGALLLSTVYVLLVKERVPNAGWWALLPIAASSAFLFRLVLVRAHLLSIPLALVITWSTARRRFGILAAACFVFPLCYTAWHLPVVLIGIVEAVRLGVERRFEWRGPAVAGVALALGITLHPNFPANLELFWIQNYTVLFDTVWSDRLGFDMGGEFGPFGALSLVRYVLLPAAAAVAAARIAWVRREDDIAPLVVAVTALAFLLITLRTQRFIEYLAPFAILALALAWRPARPRWIVPGLVAAGVAWIALFARHPVERLMDRMETFPPDVAHILQEMVPEGEQIVTCEWHITGEMMLALPERRFLVALDPVFFAMNDSDRYRLWYETINTPPEDAAAQLRDGLDARYVICDRRTKWLPLVEQLARDEQAELRGIVGMWVVFELLPAPQAVEAEDDPRVASSSAFIEAASLPPPTPH